MSATSSSGTIVRIILSASIVAFSSDGRTKDWSTSAILRASAMSANIASVLVSVSVMFWSVLLARFKVRCAAICKWRDGL